MFIHALAATTKKAPAMPETAIGSALSMCARGERRFQPNRYTPTKIASTKNAKPSRTNGKPKTSPNRSIRPGQRIPISKDSSVPDTAPAANRMPIAFAQVRARPRSSASPRRCPRHSVNTVMSGKAMP